jgi:NADH-quinone oxidoreductase subunit K
MIVPFSHVLLLAVLVFLVGLFTLVTRRNLIMMILGAEIMLNGAAIAFVGAALHWKQLEGQVVVLFILALAATEVSVGLALMVWVHRRTGSVDPESLNFLK